MGNTASAAEAVASGITHFDTKTQQLPTSVTSAKAPPPECPMHQKENQPAASECPIQGVLDHSDINPQNMMFPANQKPSPGQPFPLSTARETSSIPKVTPDGAKEFWQYPSPQMFWNAMLRKGWAWKEGEIKERDMEGIIRIHNFNNENAWEHVLSWEALHASECGNPRLKSFGGKATRYSPRARFYNMLGYDLPFDRHDWIIDRCGKDVRYIIDYYDNGTGHKHQKVALLDVRPAVDNVESAWDRARGGYLLWRKLFLEEVTSWFS